MGKKTKGQMIIADRDGGYAPVGVYLGDGSGVLQVGSVLEKWVDDFGGSAIDPTLWDVYPGGTYASSGDSGINARPLNTLNGSGVSTGITATVTNSELQIVMGTTANAEYWMVSKKMFTSPLDLYIGMRLSQRIANNSVWFELVECDPDTGELVPHLTVAGEVRNRGSMVFDGTAAGAYAIQATCDDSGISNVVTTTTGTTTAADVDVLLEMRPQDLVLSSVPMDSVAARTGSALRLSKQVPDANKAYKIRIRIRNGGTAPASSTTLTLYRVLAMDVQEITAEVTSGRGDNVAGKAMAVNITSSATVPVSLAAPGITADGTNKIKVISAAAVFNQFTTTGNRRLIHGVLRNTGASDAYLKLYNKNSAAVVGTDIPVVTLAIPAGGALYIPEVAGVHGLGAGTSGLALAITGGAADADTTALTANQIVGTLGWV